jgi:hypothetical protein
MAKTMEPIHPGEILSEEFLNPLNVSQYKLAKDINVPARRINEIVHGKRSITADTARYDSRGILAFQSVFGSIFRRGTILKQKRKSSRIALKKK